APHRSTAMVGPWRSRAAACVSVRTLAMSRSSSCHVGDGVTTHNAPAGTWRRPVRGGRGIGVGSAAAAGRGAARAVTAAAGAQPGKKRRMDALGWLIVVLVVLVVAVVAFIVVQRRRRSGGVIATGGKP